MAHHFIASCILSILYSLLEEKKHALNSTFNLSVRYISAIQITYYMHIHSYKHMLIQAILSSTYNSLEI